MSPLPPVRYQTIAGQESRALFYSTFRRSGVTTMRLNEIFSQPVNIVIVVAESPIDGRRQPRFSVLALGFVVRFCRIVLSLEQGGVQSNRTKN